MKRVARSRDEQGHQGCPPFQSGTSCQRIVTTKTHNMQNYAFYGVRKAAICAVVLVTTLAGCGAQHAPGSRVAPHPRTAENHVPGPATGPRRATTSPPRADMPDGDDDEPHAATAQVSAARPVARAFFASYIAYLYGRRPARHVAGADQSLRAQLDHGHAALTPAERASPPTPGAPHDHVRRPARQRRRRRPRRRRPGSLVATDGDARAPPRKVARRGDRRIDARAPLGPARRHAGAQHLRRRDGDRRHRRPDRQRLPRPDRRHRRSAVARRDPRHPGAAAPHLPAGRRALRHPMGAARRHRHRRVRARTTPRPLMHARSQAPPAPASPTPPAPPA